MIPKKRGFGANRRRGRAKKSPGGAQHPPGGSGVGRRGRHQSSSSHFIGTKGTECPAGPVGAQKPELNGPKTKSPKTAGKSKIKAPPDQVDERQKGEDGSVEGTSQLKIAFEEGEED